MSGLNKAQLIGRLGADPELRYTQGGTAVLNLRLAVNERWRDASGEQKERTEWFSVVLFGKRAERIEKHLRKGQLVYVEGRLQTRQWETRDGDKRSTTEVVANELLFLGGKSDGERREQRSAGQHREERWPPEGDDDALPF